MDRLTELGTSRGHARRDLERAKRELARCESEFAARDLEYQRYVAEPPPEADPITFADTCCGKCAFGTCYVDQMTGA